MRWDFASVKVKGQNLYLYSDNLYILQWNVRWDFASVKVKGQNLYPYSDNLYILQWNVRWDFASVKVKGQNLYPYSDNLYILQWNVRGDFAFVKVNVCIHIQTTFTFYSVSFHHVSLNNCWLGRCSMKWEFCRTLNQQWELNHDLIIYRGKMTLISSYS